MGRPINLWRSITFDPDFSNIVENEILHRSLKNLKSINVHRGRHNRPEALLLERHCLKASIF